MMKEADNIRPSPIAGTWYTADPIRLQQTVDGYIDRAILPDLPGEIVGVVAPHAGYRFSGQVAGYAYKTVKDRSYDCVAVISPMHQYHPQPILTSAHDAYQTPLGDIHVDKHSLTAIDAGLKENFGLALTPVAHDQEHSLEIELPFLQCALKGPFNLIPIMLRDQSREITRALAQVLSTALPRESCLLVASSDLSHFYPESMANQLDKTVLAALTDFSPEALFDLKDQGKGHACGLAAIATVLWIAEAWGAKDVTLLNYDTSASATGDRSSVVGYGAAAITRPR